MIGARMSSRMTGAWFEKSYPFVGREGQYQEYVQVISGSLEHRQFVVFHAGAALIPHIMDHLGLLWRRVHDRSEVLDRRKEALAEYEWWFFQSNPKGTAGAAMGDAMSIIAQIALGIKLRDKDRKSTRLNSSH